MSNRATNLMLAACAVFIAGALVAYATGNIPVHPASNAALKQFQPR